MSTTLSIARYSDDDDHRGPRLVESSLDITRFRDLWSDAIERVAVMALQRKIRSLGVIGAGPEVGASTFSRLIADALARIGYPSLLMDLSGEGRTLSEGRGWTSPHADPKPYIVHEAENRFRLVAVPTSASHDHFNDAPRLRELLAGNAFDNRILVLNLPPLVGRDRDAINPVASAAACEAVVLLCDLGSTTRKQLDEAVETCRAGGIKLAGVILNELSYESPGVQIGRAGRRFFRIIPPLGRWIESRALRMEILR